MLTALHRLALGAFRLLPTPARRLVVRSLSPTFTAGAIAVVLDVDDRMLLVRQVYRGRWGLPGVCKGYGSVNKPSHQGSALDWGRAVGFGSLNN